MNTKQLFLNISQSINAMDDKEFPVPAPAEYCRDLAVHVARNSPSGNITHITAEFSGNRPKFLICSMFDGFGEFGAQMNGFIMPRLKLTMEQRALIAISLFDYLCHNGFVQADFDQYKSKFIHDVSGGVNNLEEAYERICAVSDQIISSHQYAAA